jgi:hypothetical protein
MDVTFTNQTKFQESMAALRRLGGPHQRAYDEACRMFSSLGMGGIEDNKLTKHGE